MNRQFCTFVIDEYLFGIDVLLVREINSSTDSTPVDRAPDYVAGLLNLRGQIVTVIDPGVRLGLGARTVTGSSRIIVLKTTAELERYRTEGFTLSETSVDITGLLVDRIDDMIEIDSEMIRSAPANVGSIDGAFIDGVAALEKGLMVVLKVGELLG